MPASTFTLAADDGTEVFVYRWLPADDSKAVVQIVHGMAEHAGRYGRLAEALNRAGYAVYAGDLRGHGRTAKDAGDLGLFAEADGWAKVTGDLWLLNRRIATEQPGKPLVLLGHSMGSFIVQQFLAEHGEVLAAAVLSGSGGKPNALATVGRLVARLERWRKGGRGKSLLIHALSFGAFNKSFKPARTPFDWLSRDPAEVDKYAADPLCGFMVSNQLWCDLLPALARIADPAFQARIPKRLPVYVVSGSRDPVGENTKSLQQLLGAYRAAGLTQVTHRFYLDGRHEMFNEVNRDEATGDLIAWLDGVLAANQTGNRAA